MEEIFAKSFSGLTQDDRILGWSMVAFLIEWDRDRVTNQLRALDADGDGAVSREEFMADTFRFDMDGDLELNEEEQAAADDQFDDVDLDRDGQLSIETEAVAHNFRKFLELQKGRGLRGQRRADAHRRPAGSPSGGRRTRCWSAGARGWTTARSRSAVS